MSEKPKKLGRPMQGKFARVRMPCTTISQKTLVTLGCWQEKANGYGQLIDQMAEFCLYSGFEPMVTRRWREKPNSQD